MTALAASDDAEAPPPRCFHHFRRAAAECDEVFAGDGLPRAEWRPLLDCLGRARPADLRLRQARVNRLEREAGASLAEREDPEDTADDTQLDLFPRVLAPETWEYLRRGVEQRVRALNAFAADIHGPRRLLREKFLPVRTVLRDPTYRAELASVPAAHGVYCAVGAMDLLRDQAGNWLVAEHYGSAPVGLANVLQNRRVLAEACPDWLGALAVESVGGFAGRLGETLRAYSREADPFIVLLGPDIGTSFEDAFLARHLGFPLVRAADLLVRAGGVFARTVEGLVPVHVIFRRVETAALDPLAFADGGARGVPGLLNAVRLGQLTILNAPGSGVGNNRALLRHAETLCRFYLTEELRLRSVPTFSGADRDQAEYILEHLGEMDLKRLHERPTNEPQWPERRIRSLERARTLLRTHPEWIVAQPRVPEARLPVLRASGFCPLPCRLRVFYRVEPDGRIEVLPGGLSFHERKGEIVRVKDTWVLAGDDRREAAQELRAPAPLSALPLGSRVAEGLYWMGRYLERAENTARMLRILESVRWDELPSARQSEWWPLWQAVARATGHAEEARQATQGGDVKARAVALVFDARDPASILSSLRSAHINAANVRDQLSPEFWRVLHPLVLELNERAGRAPNVRAATAGETAELVVREIARLAGTAERTQNHDASWQFLILGEYLERANATAHILEQALPRLAGGGERHDQSLTALLRLLSSLDAYRRLYRARPQAAWVARLLWQHRTSPNSVAYAVSRVRMALDRLAQNARPAARANLAGRADAVLALLANLETPPEPSTGAAPAAPEAALAFPAASADPAARAREQQARLAAAYAAAAEAVGDLHGAIEDAYFSHQEAAAPEQLPLTVPTL